MKKIWLISLNIVLLLGIVAVSIWAYRAYGNYQISQFVRTQQQALKATQKGEMRTGKVGDTYVTAYFPVKSDGVVYDSMEAKIYEFVHRLLGEPSVKKETKHLLFVTVHEENSSFSTIRQKKIKAEEYKIEGVKIQSAQTTEEPSLLFMEDDTVFTLSKLCTDLSALQALVVQQSEETLRNQSVSEEAIQEQTSLIESLNVDDLTFSYENSQLILKLPDTGTLQTVEIPISTLFDMVHREYLSEADQAAYDAYQAEKEVKQNQKRIALTFDDGPSSVTTPQVLNILKRYGEKATFFILGQNVAGNEAILSQMVLEGHELGNHSFTHPVLTSLTAAQVQQEINRTQEAIQSATGVLPRFIRPPYGAINQTSLAAAGLPAIYWSVDSLDWKSRNKTAILEQVTTCVQPGSIILMHDIHQSTVDSLPSVIEALRAQGYTFVTVSELLGEKLNASYIYYSQDSAAPAQ